MTRERLTQGHAKSGSQIRFGTQGQKPESVQRSDKSVTGTISISTDKHADFLCE